MRVCGAAEQGGFVSRASRFELELPRCVHGARASALVGECVRERSREQGEDCLGVGLSISAE